MDYNPLLSFFIMLFILSQNWPLRTPISQFLCLFFFFREGEREGERERNINVWLPLVRSLMAQNLGMTWPATQACSLTGNQTSNPLVRRLVGTQSNQPHQPGLLSMSFSHFVSSSDTTRYFRLILYFPAPGWEPAISWRSPGFFYRRIVLGSYCPSVLGACSSRPSSGQSQEIDIWIQTHALLVPFYVLGK